MNASMQAVNQLVAQLGKDENRNTAMAVGGVTAVAGLTWWLTRKSSGYKKKPGTFEIGSGAVDPSRVKDEVSDDSIYFLRQGGRCSCSFQYATEKLIAVN
jgi:hypothetical protein